mgnify:CR=1 FL=1
MTKSKIFVLIVTFFLLIPFSAKCDQITLVADIWCPFNCDPGSDSPGYMIEIAQRVFKKAGHTVVYKNMPWEKAIEETRKGKFTGIVGGYKSDSPDFVFPAKPLGISHTIFFTRKGTAWRYTGIDSLKKIRLGVIEGYSYSDELDKYIAANKGKPSIFLASGDEAIEHMILKVMKGEIDAFVEDPAVYGNYCGTKKLMSVIGAIQEAGSLGPPEQNYIAFSPKNPKSAEYASLLATGLDQMRKSGELKKIIVKYHVKDWE